MFYKHKHEKLTILIVYIDDIILTGVDKEEKERFKKNLANEFEMKYLRTLKVFSWNESCKEQARDFNVSKEVCTGLVKQNWHAAV